MGVAGGAGAAESVSRLSAAPVNSRDTPLNAGLSLTEEPPPPLLQLLSSLPPQTSPPTPPPPPSPLPSSLSDTICAPRECRLLGDRRGELLRVPFGAVMP